jgi:integrase/recombinase XerD
MLADYLHWTQIRNYSEATVRNRRVHIGFFLNWCIEPGYASQSRSRDLCWRVTSDICITTARKDGEPLSFHSQHSRFS